MSWGPGGSRYNGAVPSLQEFRARHGAVVRCVVVFLVVLAGLSLLIESDLGQRRVILPFTVFVTWCAAQILTLFGTSTSSGTLLSYRSFAVDILGGCSGDIVHAVFLAGLLGFPASWRARAWGFVLGMPAVFLINQSRIVVLCLLGYHQPTWFDSAHLFFGQAGVIVATLAIWVIWIEVFSPRAAR